MNVHGLTALTGIFALCIAMFCPNCCADNDGLAVEMSAVGKAYLTYKRKPLFAFGPGDEMRLLNGTADVERWVTWQAKNGMNLVRAYPISVPMAAYGAPGIAPFLKQGDKWDVDAFNEDYFKHIGDVAKTLEKKGIILHLQLWQIVFFKGGDRRWDINFLNPRNNVNAWTQDFSRGSQYINAPSDSIARQHQQRWVYAILDAMKGRGNVIVDVINELGNEMGTLEWAVTVADWVHDWEQENKWSFIVGVDSEHHYSPEQFGAYCDHFDIVILNELRSYENGRNVVSLFGMPTVSVRSSDGTNRHEDYMFARADQTGPEHQTRYRTLCYRSLFAGLQSVGAYWKSEVQEADYRDMELWPEYAKALRAFWEILAPYWPRLAPNKEEGTISGAITPHAYSLVAPTCIAVYLECGSHTWNNEYAASTLRVTCDFESVSVRYLNPRTGDIVPIGSQRDGDVLLLSLPPFTDDAIVIIENASASPS
mgnify:CR=1 FL=1